MATWQRKARLLIAVGATAFAVVVAFAFRTRVELVTPEIVTTDPNAVIETAGGRTTFTNRNKEESTVEFERSLSYPDGTTRGLGVKIVTERGGKTYVLQANEGQQGAQKDSTIVVSGNVRVQVSDGLSVLAERGVYDRASGVLEAPGPVTFSRGRMTGSSQGMTFRDLDDVMILPADVVIRVTPDAEGGGAIDMKAGSAEISRAVHTIHLAGGVTTSRPSGTTLSDTALARLTPEEDRLQALELRGQSRLASRAPEPGALQSVTGRDMDLAYGPDGQTLQRVVVMGDADLTIAGERGRTGRQLTTDRMTIALSANGTAPIGLTAQGRVRMSLPAEDGVPRRTIAAQDFTANGTEERGLTSGRFSGRVEFSERAARAERTATSETLELVLAGGLSAIEEARFAGSVQFLEGGTRASSARAVYRLRDGTLGLTGPPTPLVVRDQLTVQATRIDLNLEREQITASGAVKSELQPRKGRASETRLPSLLSDENPVSIFAERLAYEGTAGTALYTGNVRLVQSDGKGDDTAIKSETLTLDETSGNLIADGAVVTTVTLDQVRDDGRKERVLTTVRSSHLQYDDAARRAVYSGGAQLSSAEGDLTAARVEIFLLPEGRELDRMDAHEKAEMVASDKRRATGAQITYRANDRSYHVTGAPAVLSDACGDAEGRTITFFRATDRMIINGQEGRRSRTRGTAGCS